jgi:hypothetical protein
VTGRGVEGGQDYGQQKCQPFKQASEDTMGRPARAFRPKSRLLGMERPIMNDLSRSRKVLEQDSTSIAVVELSLSNWVVAGIVPGLDRQPMKKLGADHDALLQLVERWRDEAIKAGRTITRTVVAFETGRDGFGWRAD